MSPLLVGLLGVLLVPLFVASWRMSLFGLGCQGVIMACIAYRLHPQLGGAQDWLELFDLGLARGIGVPIALYAVQRARGAPARNDVIPPNLLSWTLAFAMVFVSFNFAEVLVQQPGEQRTLIAVAASGVAIGFLVLATQSDPFSQVLGALRIENAIALVELGGEPHGLALGIRLGLLAVFITTVALFRAYLVSLDAEVVASQDGLAESEGPTL